MQEKGVLARGQIYKRRRFLPSSLAREMMARIAALLHPDPPSKRYLDYASAAFAASLVHED